MRNSPEFYTTIDLDGVHFECGYNVIGNAVWLYDVNLQGSKYEIYQFLAYDVIKELEGCITAERAPRVEDGHIED